MVVLVDTNIIIDALADRQPYASEARMILEKCATDQITGILAAHSVSNLFYILRRNFDIHERRLLLKNLCQIFHVSDIDKKKIISALANEQFSDFEDCLQEECAVSDMADFIVTRNKVDFQKSRVPAVLPEELLGFA